MRIFRDYLKGFQAFSNSEGYIKITLRLLERTPTSLCVLHINPSGQNFNAVCISQNLSHFSALILSMFFMNTLRFFAVFLQEGNFLKEFIQNFGLSTQTATGDCSHWFKCSIFRALLLVLVHLTENRKGCRFAWSFYWKQETRMSQVCLTLLSSHS